ncbi:hypothetical protein [Amycolatopsis rubida]|uniref:STAS domain-containing protein n=1 Tax=Amycolatopsis rubida TaxID=112413 RepID=A0A1I5ZC24_9PSEU|nr:hypothetical protein [Amycolatopsis rubida]SFQ54014.1 hypothetical protein SAMN05421854_114193 [Amycolatopsis rubida]
MSALEVRAPVRAERWLKTRMLAADGTITVVLEGRLIGSGVDTLVAELAEALELCCGVVIVEATACRCDGDTLASALGDAAVAARRARCGLRVVTADIDVAIALDGAGISRTVRT